MDMCSLAAQDRERIVAEIEQFAGNSLSLARRVAAMTGSNYGPLRVGQFSVVFIVENSESLIMTILRIRQRQRD